MGTMIRVNDIGTDSLKELESVATDLKLRIRGARARCMHGHTRQETCVDCEGGYSTDGSDFFLPRIPKGHVVAFAYSDGFDVAYVAVRKE